MKFQQVSMIKRNNVWVARECCKLARDIHGGNGISGEYQCALDEYRKCIYI